MFEWLNTHGQKFIDPVRNNTNYLTDYIAGGTRKSVRPGSRKRPFPLNEHYFSHPILSRQLREEIWKRVKQERNSVRSVSIALGVEMRRVGAVVRLVELEKQLRKEVSYVVLFDASLHDEQHKID